MERNEFYQKLFQWLKGLSKKGDTPFFLGISGPQGCGKSTLSSDLVKRLKNEGLKALTLSIDDFYLKRTDQQNLADATNNPYLQHRGYPGTHDVELGTQTLNQLKKGHPTRLPAYDKSQFQGLGDRVPSHRWLQVNEPQDVVILEGWMLGFIPQEELSDVHLEETNDYLKNYEPWLNTLNAFLFLESENLDAIVNWRVEAEKNQRALGKDGMSDQQAKSYIESFLPAYKLFGSTPHKRRDQFEHFLHFQLKRDRRPKDVSSFQNF